LDSKKSFRVSDDSSGTVFVVPGVFSKSTVLHFDERRGSSDGGAFLLKAANHRYGIDPKLWLDVCKMSGKLDNMLTGRPYQLPYFLKLQAYSARME
jgi:hypothetical protein